MSRGSYGFFQKKFGILGNGYREFFGEVFMGWNDLERILFVIDNRYQKGIFPFLGWKGVL